MAQGTFEYIGYGLGDVRSGRLTTLEEFGANYNRRFIHAKKTTRQGYWPVRMRVHQDPR